MNSCLKKTKYEDQLDDFISYYNLPKLKKETIELIIVTLLTFLPLFIGCRVQIYLPAK